MDEDESEDLKVGAATDYEYVTEAYGAVSCSAKVTKHVARVKMPNTGLTWNEDYLVSDTQGYYDHSTKHMLCFRSMMRV